MKVMIMEQVNHATEQEYFYAMAAHEVEQTLRDLLDTHGFTLTADVLNKLGYALTTKQTPQTLCQLASRAGGTPF